MKKNMISALLASLGALAALPAAADVTLYGIAQGSIDYGNNGGNVGNHAYYQDIGTRVGFKGSDKLDNGSYLNWNVYQYMAAHGGEWGSREAWIGLSDERLGSFRAGKSKSTYSQMMDDFDLFESNTTLVSTFNDSTYKSFPTSSVFYTSPNLGGLVLKGDYQFKDGANDQFHGYAASAKYSHEWFALYGIYQRFGNAGRDLSDLTEGGWYAPTAASGKSMSSWMLGAQVYPVKNLIVGGLYQHAKQDLANAPAFNPDASDMKRDSMLLMAQYTVGPWTPRAGYVRQFAGKFNTGADLKAADQFEIGTDYNLSKHTIAYVEAAYIRNRDQNGFQSSAGTDGWSATKSGDSKVISFGLIELF
ncbi:porin [Silvimonas iriomotensis]|uniref:Membrane protein n=1 Tax=Silvimonas iriomotensis TaxID=449662 RepID=A0ABQ2P5Q8_9NEIS|nr:porin [Silvimonas iriomotensis]GGP18791.1 membrane protein [Silvimonas iriomotensis]